MLRIPISLTGSHSWLPSISTYLVMMSLGVMVVETPRAAQPPRPALAALKSRPWSVPGEAGIKFCTQMGVCASPPELGRVAPTGDGERSEQVVACSRSRRTGCPGPHLVAGGHVAEFPGRRSGLGSASFTL